MYRLEIEPLHFRRRWLGGLIAVAGGFGLVVALLNGGGGDTRHGVLISIAGGLAVKFFGKKRGDADEDAQGEHPVVRFLFKAMNSGEYEGAEEFLDPSFRAFAQGYPLGSGEVDSGPGLLVESIRYWREAVPDTRWELYDEISQKEPERTDGIAFRFVHSGTYGDEWQEFEGAAFAKVVDKKLTELRLVVDMTAFNRHRRATGLAPLE